MEELLYIFNDFLEKTWPSDMAPSNYNKALEELDELGMLSFNEILDAYSNLYINIEDYDLEVDDDLEFAISEAISDHIAKLEDQMPDEDYDNDYF